MSKPMSKSFAHEIMRGVRLPTLTVSQQPEHQITSLSRCHNNFRSKSGMIFSGGALLLSRHLAQRYASHSLQNHS